VPGADGVITKSARYSWTYFKSKKATSVPIAVPVRDRGNDLGRIPRWLFRECAH
jgi:hypothetical protein